MFEYIKGVLASKGDTYAVLDINGVGYKLTSSQKALEAMTTGKSVTMYTYMSVKEDSLELFGFISAEERAIFMQLISVNGVGPKAAMGILSVTTPSSLALAIITDDSKTITKAPGIGKKLAQRIILELKDKLKNEQILPDMPQTTIERSGAMDEAADALMVLGYSQSEAYAALSGFDKDMDVEDIVKQALKKMMN